MRAAAGYVFDKAAGSVVMRAASLEEQVKETLRAILMTRKGERARKPEMGSELHRYLFRPLSQALLAEIQAEVRGAITRCEPRVKVNEVQVRSHADAPERLDLRIDFEVKQTRKPGQVRVELHA